MHHPIISVALKLLHLVLMAFGFSYSTFHNLGYVASKEEKMEQTKIKSVFDLIFTPLVSMSIR
jgi:hypothetical protein